MNELDEIRQRLFTLETDIENHEIRINNLIGSKKLWKNLDGTIGNHEDRIGLLEEAVLILRAKIEPETLTEEAIERAHTIAREREEPEKEPEP